MYAKVFAQIYDGTLCTKGPWEALVTFQQMLVLADQEGNVDMTASAIARRTTIPLEIIERGISELMKPDLESRTPTEEGRRLLPLSEGRTWGWRVVNYVHYRALKREDDRREYHREYWHKRKAKEELNTLNKTQHAQPSQPIAYAEAEAEAIKKGEAPARKRAPPILRPEDVSEQVWQDWLQHRAGKRAKVTPTVLAEARKEALKAAVTLERFLTIWCARGSQGLEASWLKPDERGTVTGETPYQRNQRERMEQWAPGIAARAPGAKADPFTIDMELPDVLAIKRD